MYPRLSYRRYCGRDGFDNEVQAASAAVQNALSATSSAAAGQQAADAVCILPTRFEESTRSEQVSLRQSVFLLDNHLERATIKFSACSSKISSTAGSKAERLHLDPLRRLLGVQQGTPIAVVLADSGKRYLLRQRWLLRAVKLWNLAVTASIALAVAPHPSQAAMGTAASGGAGRNSGTAGPPSASSAYLQKAVQSACSTWQLKQLQGAATREGASKLQHYTPGVCGGTLEAAGLGTRAAYRTAVRERSRRAALAQLQSGFSLGA
ncbi:hypothetical protein ACK3TF_003989 [Chlorella vulgaris]